MKTQSRRAYLPDPGPPPDLEARVRKLGARERKRDKETGRFVKDEAREREDLTGLTHGRTSP